MSWLVIEEVCSQLRAAYVVLLRNNSTTVGWVKRLLERGQLVAMQVVQALALQLKKAGESPLTPLHISGEENAMMDITSRLFGSNPSQFCKNDTDLLNFFNTHLPFPNQASWNVFRPSSTVSMNIISVLLMNHFEMREWLQLKKAGKHVGKIGVSLSALWEWSLGYRMPRTRRNFGASQASQLAYTWAAMVEANKLQLAQYLGRSRLLIRRSIWPMKEKPPRHKATNFQCHGWHKQWMDGGRRIHPPGRNFQWELMYHNFWQS